MELIKSSILLDATGHNFIASGTTSVTTKDRQAEGNAILHMRCNFFPNIFN